MTALAWLLCAVLAGVGAAVLSDDMAPGPRRTLIIRVGALSVLAFLVAAAWTWAT